MPKYYNKIGGKHFDDLSRTMAEMCPFGVQNGMELGGILTTRYYSVSSGVFYYTFWQSTTDPQIKRISYPGSGNQIIDFGDDERSFIFIDEKSQLVRYPDFPEYSDIYDKIYLGRLIHLNGLNLDAALPSPQLFYKYNLAFFNFTFINPLRIKGCRVDGVLNGGYNRISSTASDSFGIGINYSSSWESPNIRTRAARTPYITTLRCGRVIQATGKPQTDVCANAEVDYKNYWDGASFQAVGVTNWTYRSLFFYPESDFYIAVYPDTDYKSKAEAVQAMEHKENASDEYYKLGGIKRAVLVLRQDLDFSDETTFVIYDRGYDGQ
jgi:hypothetical protein